MTAGARRLAIQTICAAAAGVHVAGHAAVAETYTCRFGDSRGVGHRGGQWELGAKPGSVEIVFRQAAASDVGTRSLDGQPPHDVAALVDGSSVHFFGLLGPRPGNAFEVTTIRGAGAKRAAVRSIHAPGFGDELSSLTDYGFCEVAP
jgi:hypothetical protein